MQIGPTCARVQLSYIPSSTSVATMMGSLASGAAGGVRVRFGARDRYMSVTTVTGVCSGLSGSAKKNPAVCQRPKKTGYP